MNHIKNYQYLFLTLLITTICIVPTLNSYHFGSESMYQCHDHIINHIRYFHFENSIRQGVFPPTWITSLNFGLGSPVFLYLWFLPFYLVLPLRFLGLTINDSIKILFLLSHFLSGVTIYYLVKKFTDKSTALIAIPFYLLSPVRFNTIFTRCSLGESLAHVLIPLVLLSIIQDTNKNKIIGIISLSAIALTHNLSLVFSLAMISLWTLLNFDLPKFKHNLFIVATSLLLTLFFWLPALVETSYTHYPEISKLWYQDQFVPLKAMISSPWQYGPPQPSRQQLSMSFQLGKIHWLAISLVPVLILFKKRLSRIQYNVLIFALLLFVCSIFFQLPASKTFWDSFDLIKIIILPWRLQILTLLAMTIIAVLLTAQIKFKTTLLMLSLTILLIANRHHIPTQIGETATDSYISQYGHAGGSSGEYLPKWFNIETYRRWLFAQTTPYSQIISDPNVTVEKQHLSPKSIVLDLDIKDSKITQINQLYFPLWLAYLDDNESPVLESNGFISIKLPHGKHRLELIVVNSQIRTITLIISTISIISFLIYLYNQRHEYSFFKPIRKKN